MTILFFVIHICFKYNNGMKMENYFFFRLITLKLTKILMCFRFEVDVLRLPLNERQLYTNVLDPGKGKLIFLVTLKPCWGVSMCDADNPTLANQDERDAVMERYVCFSLNRKISSMKKQTKLFLLKCDLFIYFSQFVSFRV